MLVSLMGIEPLLGVVDRRSALKAEGLGFNLRQRHEHQKLIDLILECSFFDQIFLIGFLKMHIPFEYWICNKLYHESNLFGWFFFSFSIFCWRSLSFMQNVELGLLVFFVLQRINFQIDFLRTIAAKSKLFLFWG